jgi:hypothetical protein
MYIQQDATLHSLFYLETALHVSGGITTHHQERKQLYLQQLVFVAPLLLPAARRGCVVSSTPQLRFTPGKDPVTILQGGGWAPGPVWWDGKSRPPPGFDPRTVQLVVNRYTD